MSYSIVDHLTQIQMRENEIMTIEFPRISRLCIDVISQHFGITEQQMKKRLRTRPIPEARFIYFFAMSEHCSRRPPLKYKYSIQNLAKVFNRDHATALHGIRWVESNIEVNRMCRADYRAIFERLYRCGYTYPLARFENILANVPIVEKFI